MKLRKTEALPEVLIRKIRTIEVARRGLPVELTDLEAGIDEADASGAYTAELTREMEKEIDKERAVIKQASREYSMIRKQAVPVTGGSDDRGIVICTAGSLFADGYIKAGVDARAYADIQTVVTVGDNVLMENWFHVGFEESRICPATEYFTHYLEPADFSAEFWATEGQEVRISIRFPGCTWTRGKGDAEVEVDFFGVL